MKNFFNKLIFLSKRILGIVLFGYFKYEKTFWLLGTDINDIHLFLKKYTILESFDSEHYIIRFKNGYLDGDFRFTIKISKNDEGNVIFPKKIEFDYNVFSFLFGIFNFGILWFVQFFFKNDGFYYYYLNFGFYNIFFVLWFAILVASRLYFILWRIQKTNIAIIQLDYLYKISVLESEGKS